MNINDLQAEINAMDQDAAQAKSSTEPSVIPRLLNIIERLAGENDSLKTDLQNLSDEINRLKGEQGKPNIKANKKKNGDISSESERKEAEANADRAAENGNDKGNKPADGKKKRQRESKLSKIKIDREQFCPLDKTGLPDDLEFKGYEDVVIQDLLIQTDNVKYRREIYYSLSQSKSYRGELPVEVRDQGEYGPGIRALIPILKSEGNLSEMRILGFFQNFGIRISAAYLSQQWTDGYTFFHQEKTDLYRSGLIHSDYVQIDDTSARVNGINQYCQVVCSPSFTAYFTTPSKDRLTVLSVLTNFAPPQYLYNPQARSLLCTFKLTDKALDVVEGQLPYDTVMNETEFKMYLNRLNDLGVRQSVHLSEACAIAYYQQQTEFPIIKTLLADDAPQFKLLTLCLALCWIHDGRHYKKLKPFVPIHQQALAQFLSRYWAYYTELLNYKREPTLATKLKLAEEFDNLFSSITGYDDLDDRIAKTRAKKSELLLVLDYPQIPLHNNAAELGARVQARYRDVSFQTRSGPGTKIKDTFMTINQTAKKLGVSFYEYVYDRVTKQYKLPSLADLIIQKALLAQA
jgi:hypothetical protein